MRRGRFWFASLLACVCAAAPAAEPTRVTPTDPSPLAATGELVERQFGPLDAFRIRDRLGPHGAQATLDLADERLLVRIPAKPGADGRYGLLVYLDARPQARFDFEWNNVLDARALILVVPDGAGDDADTMDRRIPLALHAYEYVRRRFDLDPGRVYAAGSAGGSRVAERLALTYPDVFTGAIVNSGAVELGKQVPVPAPELLRLLRTRSTLVFATSKHDQPAFSEQQRSLQSLRAYCVANERVFDNGHTVAGHAPLTGRFLSDFIDAFKASRKEGPSTGAACERSFEESASAALADIRRLEAGGRQHEALEALAAFDRAYGRLYPADVLALAQRLVPAIFVKPPASTATPAESH